MSREHLHDDAWFVSQLVCFPTVVLLRIRKIAIGGAAFRPFDRQNLTLSQTRLHAAGIGELRELLQALEQGDVPHPRRYLSGEWIAPSVLGTTTYLSTFDNVAEWIAEQYNESLQVEDGGLVAVGGVTTAPVITWHER